MKEEDLLHDMTKMTKYFASNFGTAQQRIQIAQKTFGDGYWGEAFLILTEILEFQMINLWTIFLLSSTRTKFNRHKELALGLKTYTEILWQIGYISESQRSDLKAFQTGRNNVVHYVGNHLQKGHPSEKSLKDQFRKGLKISIQLTKIFQKKSNDLTHILIKKLGVPADTIIWNGKTWEIRKTKK